MSGWELFESAYRPLDPADECREFRTIGLVMPNSENAAGFRGSLLHSALLAAQIGSTPQLLLPTPEALHAAVGRLTYLIEVVQREMEEDYPVILQGKRSNGNVARLIDRQGASLTLPVSYDLLRHYVDTKGRGYCMLADRIFLRRSDGTDWEYPATSVRQALGRFTESYRRFFDSEEALEFRELRFRRIEFYRERMVDGDGHTEPDGAIALPFAKPGGFELKTGNAKLDHRNGRAARDLARHFGHPIRVLVMRWKEESVELDWTENQFEPSRKSRYAREVRYRDDAWWHRWATTPVPEIPA